MALEQRLNLKLAQKLVMTPTLQQAIKLLQLSRLELEQALAQELETNPVLEVTEETPAGDEAAADAGQEGGTAESAAAADETPDADDPFQQIDVEELFGNIVHSTAPATESWEEEGSFLENSASPPASMFDVLSEQLRLQVVDDALRSACEFVIGNLEPEGYLRTPVTELALQLGTSTDLVERAIAVVQSLEPAGIAARSLQECFLIQLRRDPSPVADARVREMAIRVVEVAFDDLLHQRWDKVTRAVAITVDDIRLVLEAIRHLDPRPGLQLGPTDNAVVEPDVTVRKVDGRWEVSLDDNGLPRLRLSPRYLRMLKSRDADKETTGYLRERVRAALWFLRSVDQRQNTILKVADAIVRRQNEFFERGLSYLKPLVLRDIADDIGMHESTVSRVVSNKYMASPRGVFPMKFFFHSAISHAVDGDISSVVVKERIRELIAAEDAAKPLSDARVARQLNRLGIRIARRTVAKYREELNIPSSEQRRRALR